MNKESARDILHSIQTSPEAAEADGLNLYLRDASSQVVEAGEVEARWRPLYNRIFQVSSSTSSDLYLDLEFTATSREHVIDLDGELSK